MKNLIHPTVIIFIALFTSTSCYQDGLVDLSQLAPTENKVERTSTNTNTVYESNLTFATAATIENITIERATKIETINCNSETIYGDTRGATSTFSSNNNPCSNNGTDTFLGDDNIFYFIVTNDPQTTVTHHFELKDLNDDLDLFLYTLTPQGRVHECKASSITIGLDDELIEVSNLNSGAYILVVDGWMEGVASTYTLDVYCSARSISLPSINIMDLVETIDFGIKNDNGNNDEIGKIYLDDEQWKEHIWESPNTDTFEDDVLLEEFERGDNYMVLNDADDRYIEIQFEEEKIYIYSSGFSDLEIYDIMEINQ